MSTCPRRIAGRFAVLPTLASLFAAAAAATPAGAQNTVKTWGAASSSSIWALPTSADSPSIAAGGAQHSVVASRLGRVTAWGDNSRGQCDVPTGMNKVVALAAGSNHTLALTQLSHASTASVVAWGDNAFGQCNVPAAAVTAATQIAAGGNFSMAILSSGSLVAWGDNSFGQTTIPAAAASASRIAAGTGHAVAISSSGAVVAWGNNSHGQCTVPATATSASRVAAGERFSVLLRFDGLVVAWGDNSLGQCNVPTLSGSIVSIACGRAHTVLNRNNATPIIWGSNAQGQVTAPADLGNAVAAPGELHTIAVRNADSNLRAWGQNDAAQCTVPTVAQPRPFGQFAKICASDLFCTAIDAEGRITTWGSSSFNGFTFIPGNVGPIAQLAGGLDHVVVLRTDGTVTQWGDQFGQPQIVPAGLTGIVGVAAGFNYSLALRGNGTVTGWGEAGRPWSTIPASLTNAVQIEGGYYHAYALRADGTLLGWGDNGWNQTATPAGLTGVRKVSAGYKLTMALRNDGTVAAWGTLASSVPAGLTGIVDIHAGNDSTFGTGCALRADGILVAWGYAQTPPTSNMLVLGCAAGSSYGMAMVSLDCDANGVTDSTELATHDCDANGVHDACQAALGAIEDCNGNGLGDDCEKELDVSLASGRLSTIGWGHAKTWTVPSAVEAVEPATLVLTARGDFSDTLEYVRVRVGTLFDQRAFALSGDCGWPNAGTATFTLTTEQLNAGIGADGALRVQLDPSIGVDPNICADGTWIEATLRYRGARPADCNANALLDACEIQKGYSADANHNGVVDECESLVLPCPSDINQSGETNGADLGILLAAWGDAPQPGLDLDGDGAVNGADLGILLAGWGPCVQ